jgi:hypothetical protein
MLIPAGGIGAEQHPTRPAYQFDALDGRERDRRQRRIAVARLPVGHAVEQEQHLLVEALDQSADHHRLGADGALLHHYARQQRQPFGQGLQAVGAGFRGIETRYQHRGLAQRLAAAAGHRDPQLQQGLQFQVEQRAGVLRRNRHGQGRQQGTGEMRRAGRRSRHRRRRGGVAAYDAPAAGKREGRPAAAFPCSMPVAVRSGS